MSIKNSIPRVRFPETFFLRTAFIFLTVTCAVKLISVGGSAKFLQEIDPIMGLPNREFILIAGVVELAAVLSIIFSSRPSIPSLIVAILGTQFLLYRVAFVLGHYPTPCPCLGSLTAWMHMPQRSVNSVLWTIAAWLCLGGFISFFLAYRRENRSAACCPVRRQSPELSNA